MKRRTCVAVCVCCFCRFLSATVQRERDLPHGVETMTSMQRAEALFDFEPTAEVELKMQVRLWLYTVAAADTSQRRAYCGYIHESRTYSYLSCVRRMYLHASGAPCSMGRYRTNDLFL